MIVVRRFDLRISFSLANFSFNRDLIPLTASSICVASLITACSVAMRRDCVIDQT